ncbi:MAG TPA: NAD(P)H-hydrate dehydratase [Candidatus Methanofastidiosa archaeon]|nr:NAD(P)H-hydrate dehydratase [Candidatus Methanofastidiosa archaeon]
MDPRIADTNARYHGLPPRLLMENAGRGMADYIKENYSPGNVCIICGTGNKGGDGFVIARHLEGHCNVDVIIPHGPSRIRTPESRENFKVLSRCRVRVMESFNPPEEWNYDLIVDAMLGTGVRGEVKEPYLSYIRKINELDIPKVSVDLPSGQGSSTPVDSDKVVSFHVQKHEGAVTLPIGIPYPMDRTCGPGNVKFMDRRPSYAHKGHGGSVAVIGGSERYHGAPIYASRAAAIICDLSYVVAPETVSGPIRCFGPDIIVEETNGENLDDSLLDLKVLDDVDSILCGVGAGKAPKTAKSLRRLYEECKKPLIIDADGLFPLREHLDLLHENICITPHANEFASLFGELPAAHAERKKTVEETAKEYGCIILLKGETDIISYKGDTWENRTGNEGMTTGGTGDILAGCTAAFAAKNGLFESALASAFVVGLAGDMVYANKDLFYTASDVLSMLPEALSFCSRF